MTADWRPPGKKGAMRFFEFDLDHRAATPGF
jgi:hypothetical protein